MSIDAHLEFHRSAIGLLFAPGVEGTDTALYVEDVPGSARPLRSCTCAASRRRTCAHLKALQQAVRSFKGRYGERAWGEVFAATLWCRLAKELHAGGDAPCADARVLQVEHGGAPAIRVTAAGGALLAVYRGDGPARLRFLERTGKVPKDDDAYRDRAALLARLALFQVTEQERFFNMNGMRTNRQSWEESFWHRLAYHCAREHGEPGTATGGTFHPAIDQGSGDFTLTYRDADDEPVVQVAVPRARVQAVLKLLTSAFPEQEDLAIHPVPLQSIFRVSQSTELDIEVRPMIRALQASGEARFFARENLERFRYGNLVYIPELGILAELESANRKRSFRAPVRMRLKRSQVPSFLAEHQEALADGDLVLDAPLRGLEIFRTYDAVDVEPQDESQSTEPDALERSWFWLSIRYGFGSRSVSLGELVTAQRQGLPYLETPEGWIDLSAPNIRELTALVDEANAEAAKKGHIRLSLSTLLRLQAISLRPLAVGGDKKRATLLERVLALRPATAYTPPRGLASTLRPYQAHGVDWLLFLYENRLAGLLCDDMGLGKTHQAMALFLTLREYQGVAAPFLVVCPTSVISHWRDKIRDHAPGLTAAVYHGAERDLEAAVASGVVLTSYGILRRDAAALAAIPFAVVVFDEVQHIKNRATLSYEAAAGLRSELAIGMTGTPIENTITDLKALFDLLLPGYLGRDEDFVARYGELDPTDEEAGSQLTRLRRLIHPFVLRRRKATVLDELPEKIEDTRTCALSDDQVGLYREAIAERGAELVARLQDRDQPTPYIHIFALLNLLKQICDHPALALHQLERAADYESGKWDLFRELLAESLDSGQKVVVFSQYLGMITLFARHLDDLGVGYVTLTGASRKRGTLIDRFNGDDDCRVFLGSLKAGGTGIDLIGGSVVIHYDRWWNAAREDQATDRVHRIGQKRAVQVFKLVTEGTLEEKIARIIDRKRQLMENVVQEDDPRLAKIFSRDELLAMLQSV